MDFEIGVKTKRNMTLFQKELFFSHQGAFTCPCLIFFFIFSVKMLLG